MSYLDEPEISFKERYPSIRIAWEGFLIGLAIATAISSAIALSMYGSGAPWEVVLDAWGKLWVLVAPTASGTVAAALLIHYHSKVVQPQLQPDTPHTQVEETPAIEKVSAAESQSLPHDDSKTELVAAAAVTMATWKYRDGVEPSRRVLEQIGMSQPVWNTAHDVLTVMGLVDGTQWAETDWSVVEGLLMRIKPDQDRIWVVPYGSHGHEMRAIHLGPLRNNRYTEETE